MALDTTVKITFGTMIIRVLTIAFIIFKIIGPYPAFTPINEHKRINGAFNKDLRIKFNPQISSYTHTLSESSTQTIGAKYPFIKRNANTQYIHEWFSKPLQQYLTTR